MPPATQYRHSTRRTFYNGRPDPHSDPTTEFPSIDPSNAQPIASIQTSSTAQIHAASQSAHSAFPAWSETSPIARSRILLKAVSLLRQRNDELATVETQDTGKPFSETSTVDVATGADVLEYYANLVASGGLNGETTTLRPDAWIYTTKAPLGVCAAIGAWNYPLQIALWKSAPCLAAGNCMVYKPSEFTCLHAELLASIFVTAGLPPGVFNVVYGDGSVGAQLTTHPLIAKVSFTGQVSTGQKVASAAGAGMKYATMELGGKSPLIILPDCDDRSLNNAVDGAMMANFFSSGQVCTNGTRVFVPRAMQHVFEARLVAKMSLVRPGDLMNPSTNFGPLISEVHLRRVCDYVSHGTRVDRARLLYGGEQRMVLHPTIDANGFWIGPTVFTDCTDAMRIVREEIFGPVMCILPYDTLDEAIRRANDTDLGLAAGVFGSDLCAAHKTVARLQAGITWINTWGESPAEMPVGGWKLSGLGVENGRRGLEGWVRNKSTLVDMSGEVQTVFSKL